MLQASFQSWPTITFNISSNNCGFILRNNIDPSELFCLQNHIRPQEIAQKRKIIFLKNQDEPTDTLLLYISLKSTHDHYSNELLPKLKRNTLVVRTHPKTGKETVIKLYFRIVLVLCDCMRFLICLRHSFKASTMTNVIWYIIINCTM